MPTYRVRNWTEYNKSPVNRGNLTIWISDEAMAAWYEVEKSGNRGSSITYSKLAIEACLMVKMLFKLPRVPDRGICQFVVWDDGIGEFIA